MKLYYFKDPVGNFGDDLNCDFWEKIWPNYIKSTRADWLVGIGSILTGKLNELPGVKLIMGSGYWASEHGKPDLTKCQIGFVRGPLTCQALGISENYAIADPAILISTMIERASNIDGRIGFMPHHKTHNSFDCKKIAAMAGVRYIDPTGPIQDVLRTLAESPKVLVEAMHGAIVADSIGVPWQRVSIFNRKGGCKEPVDFKWRDWGASLGVDTSPSVEYLLPWRGRSLLRRIINKPYIEWSLPRVATVLRETKQNGQYRLSDRKLLSTRINQVIDRINTLKF